MTEQIQFIQDLPPPVGRLTFRLATFGFRRHIMTGFIGLSDYLLHLLHLEAL
jgi:hypothetical protein